MYTKDYIQATYEVLQGKDDSKQVLHALEEYLRKRGLTKMYPQILRGLQEKILRKNKYGIPKVVVAREKDLQTFTTDIASALERLGTGGEHETVVDQSVIGGFIVRGAREQIDKSYKTKLLHAYRSLID